MRPQHAEVCVGYTPKSYALGSQTTDLTTHRNQKKTKLTPLFLSFLRFHQGEEWGEKLELINLAMGYSRVLRRARSVAQIAAKLDPGNAVGRYKLNPWLESAHGFNP